ncbi:MAG: S53 family peptidase [Acidimicrobiales bacterium]
MSPRLRFWNRRPLLATGAAASLLCATFALPALAARTTGAAPTLTGEVIPGIASLNADGPAPANQPMQLAVTVAGADDAGLQSAYRAIYTPGSASYHHFLNPAQIADRFGASPATWAAAQAWLTQGGLQVAYASATRDLLLVAGPVAAVERRFGVSINSYHAGGLHFLANTNAPSVPSALRVTHVVGLNTLDRARPAPEATSTAVPGVKSSVPRSGISLLGGNIGTQTPQELWGAYNQPASDQGAGQRAAIFGEGESASIVSDLAVFEKANGLPHVPVTVSQVGRGPFTDTSGSVEWDLDTQASTGMAPQLSGLKMYFATDLSDASVAGLFSAWEADPAAPLQANASFGECEATPVNGTTDVLLNPINSLLAGLQAGIGLQNDLQAVGDPILAKATLQGKTLFSSSGDTGSSCPIVAVPVAGAGNGVLNQVVPFTNYPASSPFVVGVGGTVLYTNGSGPTATRASEYAWTFGGGGDTVFIPAPAYQHGVANLTLPCASGGACRGVPDVSAMSGDVLTNAYPIINDGKPTASGGTSLSSPLWVGMWARVQAASASGGHGFANETIYRLAKNPVTYARDFHDINTGLLGLPLVGNGLYPTQPGWDYATGWGSPNVANLIADAGH